MRTSPLDLLTSVNTISKGPARLYRALLHMPTNTTSKDVFQYLNELRETGRLSAEKTAALAEKFNWDPGINSLAAPDRKHSSAKEFWASLVMFLEVMNFRDVVYPQPENSELHAMRMSALPLLALNKQWKHGYLAQGGSPEILVSLLLRALWNRQQVTADIYAVSATSIYSQWTRRKANAADSIGSLEEKIGKTMFGEAWWLLCEPDNDGVALYNLVERDRPAVLQKWHIANHRSNGTPALPAGAEFF